MIFGSVHGDHAELQCVACAVNPARVLGVHVGDQPILQVICDRDGFFFFVEGCDCGHGAESFFMEDFGVCRDVDENGRLKEQGPLV